MQQRTREQLEESKSQKEAQIKAKQAMISVFSDEIEALERRIADIEAEILNTQIDQKPPSQEGENGALEGTL